MDLKTHIKVNRVLENIVDYRISKMWPYTIQDEYMLSRYYNDLVPMKPYNDEYLPELIETFFDIDSYNVYACTKTQGLYWAVITKIDYITNTIDIIRNCIHKDNIEQPYYVKNQRRFVIKFKRNFDLRQLAIEINQHRIESSILRRIAGLAV